MDAKEELRRSGRAAGCATAFIWLPFYVVGLLFGYIAGVIWYGLCAGFKLVREIAECFPIKGA